MKIPALFVALLVFAVPVFAENENSGVIPPDLMAFYSLPLENLSFSESNVVLNETDRWQIYYMQHNFEDETLNVSYSLICISKKCPIVDEISFDTDWQDVLPSGRKKVSGIFINTTSAPLGKYVYNFSIHDNFLNKTLESGTFSIEITTDRFWKLFWHNLLDTIIFWD